LDRLDLKLTDYIKTYDNVFTDDFCQTLIKVFEHNIDDNVQEYRTDLYNFDQLELNQVPGLDGVCNQMYSRLIPYYEKYFDELKLNEYIDIQSMEALRIKKYKKQSTQQFKTHVDVTDYATARRYCIAILYLNDSNGSTIFPQLDVEVKPKPGRIVMFPPTWMFPHAGLPSTNKDKYIMMTSLHYV
jgi:hypothetical protein